MLLLSCLLTTLLVTAASGGCNLQQPTVSVLDSTPRGTIIVPVIVSAIDTLDAASTNSDSNNALSPFETLANNSLMLRAPIVTSVPYRVICGDGTRALLIITMIDTDDHAPVWEQWNYTESVRETQSVPYVLPVKPKATDEPDKNSGQTLEYRILPSDYSGYFSLFNPSQSVMNISLVKQLDYETVQQVVLTLQVLDFNRTGQLVFTVNTTLTVNVINENDENPVWLNCTAGAPEGFCYVRQLLSNSTLGTPIEPPVMAVDGNLGLNLSIFYSIVSQSPSNIINLNNATGVMTLNQSPPPPNTYTIVLFATQVADLTRKRQTSTRISLSILSTSYSPPVFARPVYNVTVFENNPPGFLVVLMKATSHLSNGVTYGLLGFQAMFSIDPGSGELKTIASLDYETTPSYTFNVSATDGTGGVGLATVIVMVGNVNEYNPTFVQSEYTFNVAGREIGLEVGRVNATDIDRSTVSYSITDADYAKLFSVNSASGVVTINTTAANLPEQLYRFSVTATDGSRTGATIVTVNFGNSLIGVANASVTTISLIVLGCVFAVIIMAVIVAFVLYRRNAAKSKMQGVEDSGSEVPDSYAFGDLYELNDTSQQDNPLEGYNNNFMFGDEGGQDVGSFYRERDQGELFVSNGYYHPSSTNDLANGSIHTVSGNSSLVGSQRTLVQTSSRPQQLHSGSNLQVVQVENAVDAASDLLAGDRGGRGGPGLTVYF